MITDQIGEHQTCQL